MNSKNSKISDSHRLLLNVSDKLDLRRSGKYVALSNLSMYNTWKNIKKLHKNNKFKISAPIWNAEFESYDGSHSVSDIQDYFKYIIKKHEALTDNSSILIISYYFIYVNETENRIKFRIETEHYLKNLVLELMKLLGSIKSKTIEDKIVKKELI